MSPRGKVVDEVATHGALVGGDNDARFPFRPQEQLGVGCPKGKGRRVAHARYLDRRGPRGAAGLERHPEGTAKVLIENVSQSHCSAASVLTEPLDQAVKAGDIS